MVAQMLNQFIVKQMNVYIEKSQSFLQLHTCITLRVVKLMRALASVIGIRLFKCFLPFHYKTNESIY